MTQEEKQLLLKNLCARLPYGVKGLHRGDVHELFTIDCREANNACIQVDGYDAWFSVDTFKPYLRPMSSMTEEDNLSLSKYVGYSIRAKYGEIYFPNIEDNTLGNWEKVFKWLFKNHFDYRGLIEKDLAIEVTENNNPYEE